MDELVELFLFCGVIYYLLNFRATDMVDVIQNRIQEVYANWESNKDSNILSSNNDSTVTSSEPQRAGSLVQRKIIKNKDSCRVIRNNALFRIKESEVSIADPTNNLSFLYYCCSSCTRTSRGSLVNIATKKHRSNLSNLLVVEQKPNILSKIFGHIFQVYDFKKYNYPKVSHVVLNDDRLKDAIRETARDISRAEGSSEDNAASKLEKRARSILQKMQSTLSDLLLKITAWTLYKLLPFFLHSASVQTCHIEMLQEANKTNLPLIFMPLHRSHLDYIMISFLTVTNNIRSPLVAAGDNLRIPLFGWLMSGLGAFFIKRRMDPITGRRDVVYRAILHTYIMQCLRAGHNMEFFLEGGRSRTGKPCMPKSGILSVIVDAYMDGTIEDALLIPVSMNYEKLVDGNFVREQLGMSKKMETFGSTIRAIWATLRGNYGIVKIEICQPFSLKEMLKCFQIQQNKVGLPSPSQKQLKTTTSTSSLYGTDIVIEEHRQLVDMIARHVIYECSKSTPIMSTNIVAFLLLNKFRDGCTIESLIEAFDEMRREFERTKCDVAFCGETVDIINHATGILGPGLIKQQRQDIIESVDNQPRKLKTIIAIKPVCILPNVIELAYYSNTVILHYLMESVVITSLYAVLKSQMNDPQAIIDNDITISQSVLVENALVVCNILKYEFIFCKPCQNLEQVINDTIDNLLISGIIIRMEDVLSNQEVFNQNISKDLENRSDEENSIHNVNENVQFKLSLISEHSKRMEFLHMLLRPLIDTYVISALCLKKLVEKSISERDFIQEILNEIKINIDQGIVNYGESLSVDSIKNSLKLFEKNNILECQLEKNIKIYYLNEDYDNDTATNEVYEVLAAYKWMINID